MGLDGQGIEPEEGRDRRGAGAELASELITPPWRLAAAILTEMRRMRSSPARKRGSSVSSVSGKTCFVISDVIVKTRWS